MHYVLYKLKQNTLIIKMFIYIKLSKQGAQLYKLILLKLSIIPIWPD